MRGFKFDMQLGFIKKIDYFIYIDIFLLMIIHYCLVVKMHLLLVHSLVPAKPYYL